MISRQPGHRCWHRRRRGFDAIAVATGFSLKTRQSLMARGRNAAVIVFLIASVHKWPALTEVLAKIDMILPLQEAQNDYRSSFVILLCRYRRRDHRESLRMATGCPLRALHQAEGLEQVGVPAGCAAQQGPIPKAHRSQRRRPCRSHRPMPSV